LFYFAGTDMLRFGSLEVQLGFQSCV
jgi:hypothetical protein